MPTINKKELDPGQILTLYAVSKAPNGVPTKTHFQKMMYLIMKAMGKDPRETVCYRPHHYGPYSDIVDEWRDSLIESGWLAKNSGERISIPPELHDEVSRIRMGDRFTEMKIRNIVEFVTSLSWEEVLLYVYADDVTKGEGMTENSDVKDEVFSKRIPLAASMVRRGKVSAEKGAELAGMDLQDFMKFLGGRVSA